MASCSNDRFKLALFRLVVWFAIPFLMLTFLSVLILRSFKIASSKPSSNPDACESSTDCAVRNYCIESKYTDLEYDTCVCTPFLHLSGELCDEVHFIIPVVYGLLAAWSAQILITSAHTIIKKIKKSGKVKINAALSTLSLVCVSSFFFVLLNVSVIFRASVVGNPVFLEEVLYPMANAFSGLFSILAMLNVPLLWFELTRRRLRAASNLGSTRYLVAAAALVYVLLTAATYLATRSLDLFFKLTAVYCLAIALLYLRTGALLYRQLASAVGGNMTTQANTGADTSATAAGGAALGDRKNSVRKGSVLPRRVLAAGGAGAGGPSASSLHSSTAPLSDPASAAAVGSGGGGGGGHASSLDRSRRRSGNSRGAGAGRAEVPARTRAVLQSSRAISLHLVAMVVCLYTGTTTGKVPTLAWLTTVAHWCGISAMLSLYTALRQYLATGKGVGGAGAAAGALRRGAARAGRWAAAAAAAGGARGAGRYRVVSSVLASPAMSPAHAVGSGGGAAAAGGGGKGGGKGAAAVVAGAPLARPPTGAGNERPSTAGEVRPFSAPATEDAAAAGEEEEGVVPVPPALRKGSALFATTGSMALD